LGQFGPSRAGEWSGRAGSAAQAGYRPFCDVTEVFVGVGRVVVGAVVVGAVVVGAVVVGAVVVGAVVVGAVVVVVVVVVGAVVAGGLLGKVVQAFEASGPDTWSAGTVATAAPL
jgi:hypothetical protein